MSTPLYKKALIIGATSGIGEALANKLVSHGTKVVVVGRRQDRLDRVVVSLGPDNATGVTFDITQLTEIPSFAAKVTAEHPDIDCIVLNSGIQRAFDFSRPETVDLNVLREELTTNYISYIHLTVALLPFLQAQKGRTTHLVYINSRQAIVPGLLRTGNYNASKAALHNWVLVLREQLKLRPDNSVKVVEVFPPAVQTELHLRQPDLRENAGSIGMPLQQFTDEMYDELISGEDQFGVGSAKATIDGLEKERVKAFHAMWPVVEAAFKHYLK
jgi:short-subunit dehydrogenase involved in D-alanine esterification of teichoic acids